MNPRQFQRVSDVFMRARALDPVERLPFVESVCDDDSEVRAAVAAMLAQDRTPHALDAPIDVSGVLRLSPASGDPLPERVGRYRVLGKIGEGGMGVVYEAEQDEPRRSVALKVVKPGAATANLLRRFRQEAQLLGQLTHPGIARVYEAGAIDEGEGGRPCFAMELIEGPPLLEYADRRALGTRQRLELIARVADALHYAHRKGVVHRDLKPANILVADYDTSSAPGARGAQTAAERIVADLGQPKILDFGVARATDADVQTITMQTNHGQLVGTVPYMSPEQATGDPAAIDCRCDVYSLGVITFELLTGRLPYPIAGKLVHEAVRVIREEEPSRLSSVNRVFRGDVETIVAKALEKAKERRYQSAAEMAGDIRRYLHDQPIVARPASALYQLGKFARRNKAIAAGVGIAFATLALATVFTSWQWSVADHQRSLATTRAEALEASAWDAYRHAIASAATALEYGDPVVAETSLGGVASEHRNWEHGYLATRLDPASLVVTHDEPVRAAALPDQGGLLTVTAGAVVRRWEAAGPPQVRLDASRLGPAALTPDGRRMAGVVGPDRDEVAVWDAASGRRVATLSGAVLDDRYGHAGWRPLRRIAISPTGDWVAVAGSGQRAGLTLWKPDVPDPPTAPTQKRATALAFSSDGRRLALGFVHERSGWADLLEVELETLRPLTEIPWRASHGSEAFVGALAYADRWLVAASDTRAHLHDRATGASLHFYGEHRGVITAAAVGPGGTLVATGADDGTVRLWDVETLATRSTFVGHDAPVDQVTFGVESRRLLTIAGRAARVFNLVTDDRGPVLHGHELYVYGVGFVEDGQRIVSAAWDGTLRFWDGDTGAAGPVVNAGDYRRYICMDAAARGTLIATGHEHDLRLWDSKRATEPLRKIDFDGRVTSIDVTDDGARVAARTSTGVTVWAPRTDEPVAEIPLPGRGFDGAVALSPDGWLVAADAEGAVVVHDARSGSERLRLPSTLVRSLAFSPDGGTLAGGCIDGTVRVWDVTLGVERFALEGHRGIVWAVAFSPDGTRLASGADDRTIRIWDPVRGAHLLRLTGHDEYVFSLSFSPAGDLLASGSGDHTVRLWPVRPIRVLHHAGD